MVMDCSLPLALSLAETERIPLASISNLTSICGTPLGAGGIPYLIIAQSVCVKKASQSRYNISSVNSKQLFSYRLKALFNKSKPGTFKETN